MIERIEIPVADAVLSARVAGPEQGLPMVLLHGIPANSGLWCGVMPILAQAGWRVWAPDLPGYGQSRISADADHSLGGAAALVSTWLGQMVDVGGRPPWLVGHDLGGGVAQIVAARTPHLISGLTLGDTVAEDSWPVLPVKLFRWVAWAGLYPALCALGLMPNFYARRALAKGMSRPVKPEEASEVFWGPKVSAPVGRRAFARHLKALDPRQTVEAAPALKSLKVPTGLLWADGDHYQPWLTVGRRLESLLPQTCESIIIPGGHFLPLDNPRGYAEALLTLTHQARV
ncbi:MAG: alpha/beta fold hydrolase [Bradymonadia bacterium]